MTQREALEVERMRLYVTCRELIDLLARALAHQPGDAPVLQRMLNARYDQLEALDMAIASYDPQLGLFPDYVNGNEQGTHDGHDD